MGKAQDAAGSLQGLAKGKAADEALGRFYTDSADKDRLYKRLSPIVGAFDHAEMDSAQVVLFGVKELGIQCAAGTERIALDAYLNATEAANKAAQDFVPSKGYAADSASTSGCPELDKYLKGE